MSISLTLFLPSLPVTTLKQIYGLSFYLKNKQTKDPHDPMNIYIFAPICMCLYMCVCVCMCVYIHTKQCLSIHTFCPLNPVTKNDPILVNVSRTPIDLDLLKQRARCLERALGWETGNLRFLKMETELTCLDPPHPSKPPRE